jgi:starch synthase
MRILLASSEVHPYSKTGGLADMIGAMGQALARAGHRVGIVTPLYRGVMERFPEIQRVDWRFDLPFGKRRVQAELWSVEPAEGLTVYFIHQPAYYHRAGIYQENGTDYPDNGERFIFFSKCVTHLARYLPWQPEIIHANDWHTGLVPLLVLHQSKSEGWGNPPPACMTIHNLAYQGIFPRATFNLTNLPQNYFNPEAAEFYGQLNCLKAGIAFARVVTTVSPRYAREITTEEFGHGLDGLLRKRRDRFFGILNGVDYDEWNTERNPHLCCPYSADDLFGKNANKAELQRECGLPVNLKVPLFGSITRLAEQKGVDIALGALEEMLHTGIQFVLLGSGTPNYERAFLNLAERFPSRAAVRLGFDQGLSHRIEAGCDFFIMPSRFEPCGLNQMYSLRYGTIPIVRTTGGLDDTVLDATHDTRKANGIKFTEYSAQALAKAIRKALIIYEDPKLLDTYRQHAMAADFSWNRTVAEYEVAYKMALER